MGGDIKHVFRTSGRWTCLKTLESLEKGKKMLQKDNLHLVLGVQDLQNGLRNGVGVYLVSERLDRLTRRQMNSMTNGKSDIVTARTI